jgi:CubicO group peptidase (beta-lactamase class C family)
LFWVLGTGCASDTHALPTTRHRLSEAGAVALSQQLDAAVARGDTPGVVALVVDRDGVLYEGSAGKLDVTRNLPMRPDAIFRIASMTKPINISTNAIRCQLARIMALTRHRIKCLAVMCCAKSM